MTLMMAINNPYVIVVVALRRVITLRNHKEEEKSRRPMTTSLFSTRRVWMGHPPLAVLQLVQGLCWSVGIGMPPSWGEKT